MDVQVGVSRRRFEHDATQRNRCRASTRAEQQRIVAKVDELMRWCDALEARLTATCTTAAHLLDATLHQILDAPLHLGG